MPSVIAPQTLSHLREQRSALGLIDVREHGEFNLAHIPGASSLPRRLLELRIEHLVPCKRAQIVLCDDSGPRATLAAATLESLGYTRVAVLQGGVNLWASLDFPTQWGMNVISKRFGEQLQIEYLVPTIDAIDLNRRVEQGEEIVILDTRTPEEFQKHCIPGGRSMPGGELALRISDVRKSAPGATIVINCAGRTRSIFGTRLLQRMGIPGVFGLRNGTSGWVLAGLKLEEGASRLDLTPLSREGVAVAEAFARKVGQEDGVNALSIDKLDALLTADDEQCIYLVDVRTESEYAKGHIPGFWHFPGGQAVQRADDVVAVGDGIVVFCCDGFVRSTITASWFRQMEFANVYIVDGGTTAWANAGRALVSGSEERNYELEGAKWISPGQLYANLQVRSDPAILHVGTSRDFAQGHVPGAVWLNRSWLELRIESVVSDPDASIVVTDSNCVTASLAAVTLVKLGYRNVKALRGGMSAWHRENLPVERGLSGVLFAPDDVVPPPTGPERSYADMINYLRWEELLGVPPSHA